MIDYSVSARPNPQDRDAEVKYYASPQVSDNMSTEEFCKHIASHGSVYGRADVQAILTQCVDCLREMLLEGKKVSLGELGSFAIGLHSTGTLTADEFNPAIHVKSVKVNWTPGAEFLNLKGDVEYNLVTVRSVQKRVLQAIKNGETTVTLTEAEEEAEE